MRHLLGENSFHPSMTEKECKLAKLLSPRAYFEINIEGMWKSMWKNAHLRLKCKYAFMLHYSVEVLILIFYCYYLTATVVFFILKLLPLCICVDDVLDNIDFVYLLEFQ